jgi:hypothetical protein
LPATEEGGDINSIGHSQDHGLFDSFSGGCGNVNNGVGGGARGGGMLGVLEAVLYQPPYNHMSKSTSASSNAEDSSSSRGSVRIAEVLSDTPGM